MIGRFDIGQCFACGEQADQAAGCIRRGRRGRLWACVTDAEQPHPAVAGREGDPPAVDSRITLTVFTNESADNSGRCVRDFDRSVGVGEVDLEGGGSALAVGEQADETSDDMAGTIGLRDVPVEDGITDDRSPAIADVDNAEQAARGAGGLRDIHLGVEE